MYYTSKRTPLPFEPNEKPVRNMPVPRDLCPIRPGRGLPVLTCRFRASGSVWLSIQLDRGGSAACEWAAVAGYLLSNRTISHGGFEVEVHRVDAGATAFGSWPLL